MGLFDGILIYSDVDGTLVDQNRLSVETEKAVRYFQQNGGLFSLATGRAPHYIHQFMPRLIPNAPLIACNGTLIYDLQRKEQIWQKPFGEEWKDYVECILRKFPEHDFIHVMAGNSETVDWTDWSSAQIDKLPRPIYKAVFRQDAATTQEMKKIFSSGYPFKVSQSCPVLFEISASGSGKDACIQKMRELLKNKVKTVVCVGDYDNDIDMLREADIGVAVQGGYFETLQAADWIAPPIDQHPIAWLIHEIERKLIRENSL